MGKRGPTTGLSIDTLRPQIYARDGYVCQYCGTTTARHFIIEHVVPIEEGPTHPANLVVACRSCNQRKGARVWVPRNLASITADYPEWAVYVLSRAVNLATDAQDRVTAGYKIDADVKQHFAAFVRWLNRDWKAEERQEIGVIAQEALIEYMERHGWPNGQPPQEAAG